MNNSERDTHFLRFAALLWDELESTIREYGYIPESRKNRADFLPIVHAVIAQRAYDLLYFLGEKTPPGTFDVGFGTPDEIHDTIMQLPDLTAWPESSS